MQTSAVLLINLERFVLRRFDHVNNEIYGAKTIPTEASEPVAADLALELVIVDKTKPLPAPYSQEYVLECATTQPVREKAARTIRSAIVTEPAGWDPFAFAGSFSDSGAQIALLSDSEFAYHRITEWLTGSSTRLASLPPLPAETHPPVARITPPPRPSTHLPPPSPPESA